MKVRAVDADAATAESPRPETPARDDDDVASRSFDETDYVFDDEEENIACVCVEPSVLVVPEALMRDRGALPDADADVANATATGAGTTDDIITGHTPPWSFKRIDRETREFAKTARTLLEWTTGAVDAPPDFVSAFAFTADVDATTTKLSLADEWFDVTDAGDIVLALTPSDVVAAEKRD